MGYCLEMYLKELAMLHGIHFNVGILGESLYPDVARCEWALTTCSWTGNMKCVIERTTFKDVFCWLRIKAITVAPFSCRSIQVQFERETAKRKREECEWRLGSRALFRVSTDQSLNVYFVKLDELVVYISLTCPCHKQWYFLTLDWSAF